MHEGLGCVEHSLVEPREGDSTEVQVRMAGDVGRGVCVSKIYHAQSAAAGIAAAGIAAADVAAAQPTTEPATALPEPALPEPALPEPATAPDEMPSQLLFVNVELRDVAALMPAKPLFAQGRSPFSPTHPLYPPYTLGGCSQYIVSAGHGSDLPVFISALMRGSAMPAVSMDMTESQLCALAPTAR